MKAFKLIAAVCAAVFVASPIAIMAASVAFAQTPQQIVDAACANNGALLLHIMAWVGGIVGGASLIANFRNRLPSWLINIVDAFALNFIKSLSRSMPAFLMMASAALLLSACVTKPTGNLSADFAANNAELEAMAAQVQAFNTDALAKIDAFNKGAIADAVIVGKSACADAAMLNGAFALAKPIMAASAVDPKVFATEAGVMVGVNLGCSIIDHADPQTPAVTIASAVTQVVAALPQLKEALRNGPPAAQAATKPQA